MANITDFGTVATITIKNGWFYDNIENFTEVDIDGKRFYEFEHLSRVRKEYEHMLLNAEQVDAVTFME